ncbi:MAG: hypothetical protein U0931_31290 [Vulcanimicrobiota bacterium]
MDEVESIERVLCRLSLPDKDIFPALAGVRDARREGIKERVEEALWELAGRQGLDNPTTLVNFWVVLRYQVELQSERVFRFLQQFLEVSHDVRKLELCSQPFGLLGADRGGYPRVQSIQVRKLSPSVR